MSEIEIFNKEDVYDNEISPLMQKIIEICNEHKIPMIASFLYEHHEDRGCGLCTTCLNNFDNRVLDRFNASDRILRRSGDNSFAITITSEDT